MKKIIAIIISCFLFVLSGLLNAQGEEHISYKVNNRLYQLSEVKLEFHPDEGYVHIEGVKKDKIDMGPNVFPRNRWAESGFAIDIFPQGDSFTGTHTAHTADIMPVYINWYDIDEKTKKITENYASMDSGDESVLVFSITFDNFGGEGTIIKGTFSGKLLDNDGNPYEITEGRFAIQRKDVK